MLFLLLELGFYFVVGYGFVALFGKMRHSLREKTTKEGED